MFSEAFPKAVFVSRAENIKAQAKASWSLHTKNRSATQNDREKKTKTNKPVNAAPRPESGGARWYETVTQWLDDHFTTTTSTWCCERMELFYRKSQIPVSNYYYSTLTVLVWLQLSISFRLLRTFRVVMHPNFRCLKVFIIFFIFLLLLFWVTKFLSYCRRSVFFLKKKILFSECVNQSRINYWAAA